MNDKKTPLEKDFEKLLLRIWKEKRKNRKKIVFIFIIEPNDYFSYITLIVPYFNFSINCWIEFFYEKDSLIQKYIEIFNKNGIKYYNFLAIQVENIIWKEIRSIKI